MLMVWGRRINARAAVWERIDLLIPPTHDVPAVPPTVLMEGFPITMFRPGAGILHPATRVLWAYGFLRYPLCRARRIPAFPLRHVRARASPRSDVEFILRETACSSHPIAVARRQFRSDRFDLKKCHSSVTFVEIVAWAASFVGRAGRFVSGHARQGG